MIDEIGRTFPSPDLAGRDKAPGEAHLMRAKSWLILALGLLVAPISARADFLFNFNGMNDNGLSEYNPLKPFGLPGQYTYPPLGTGNFGYRLSQGSGGVGVTSNLVNVIGPSRMGSLVSGVQVVDEVLSTDVINFNSSLADVFGLTSRVTSPGFGTTNGYALLYYTPSATGLGNKTGLLTIAKITNEGIVRIGTGTSITLSPSRTYRFTFTTVGNSLTGAIADLTDPNRPLATASATDASYTVGQAGLFVSASPTSPTSALDVTFDNFAGHSILPIPEPSSIALTGIGLAGLVLVARRRGQPSRGSR